MCQWTFRVRTASAAEPAEIAGAAIRIADGVVGVWTESGPRMQWPADDIVAIDRRPVDGSQDWAAYLPKGPAAATGTGSRQAGGCAKS